MADSAKSTKKILIVDDSALMRRVFCDIINADRRFEIADQAVNGLEALQLLRVKQYDAVVLDVNMPKMDGLTLLRKLQEEKIQARVMMLSSDTREGARITLDALELGALDFVHKPDHLLDCRDSAFRVMLLDTLDAVSGGSLIQQGDAAGPAAVPKPAAARPERRAQGADNRVVVIASSTGGPKALQSVIPRLPANLNAPVLLVQHMPKGFTASLAERLDGLSAVKVKEAEEGEVLEKGVVYVAMSGRHLKVKQMPDGRHVLRYSDEPLREGVRPCANYLFESLCDTRFVKAVCVVMTGMGADGTEGIQNLKKKKDTYVIAQNQETSTVYGMPRSVILASLADRVVPLEQIAQEITANAGV